VLERVDTAEHVTGFSVFGMSRFSKDKRLVAELAVA
jgi:hypothetical protein